MIHFSEVLYFQQLQLLKNGGARAALHLVNPQLLVLAPVEILAADNFYVRPLACSCSQQMTAVISCLIQLFKFLVWSYHSIWWKRNTEFQLG